MDDDFDKLLADALDAADKALNEGRYKKELRSLLGLSMKEIKEAVPRASMTQYSKLISVVEQASAANVSQATLKSSIEALGKTVVSIAKLVAPLAGLFA